MLNFVGLKLFYFAIISIIIVGIVLTVKSLFIPLLIALFIAMVLRPLVTFFESKGFSQTSIITTMFLTFFLLVVFGFSIFIPILSEEISSFSTKLPAIISSLQDKIDGIQHTLEAKFPSLEISKFTQESISSFVNSLNGTKYFTNALNILTFSILVPFFAFFLLKDMHLIKKTLLSYIPNRYFEITAILFYKISNSVQLYIRGQIIDSSFVGIMTGIGLSIIGFPFALVVGLVAGIGNLVPYFGPILGAIPAILIIFITPEWATGSAIGLVVGVFLFVQVIETIFVYPAAVGNSVNLHPLIVVLALLIGGELAGIVGMIVIIPAVAILKVTFELLHKYMLAYRIIG
ncbi:AI-2E family transporter [Sulfurimonas sp.]|nr:AI-2E family transporter [Sulfurimonas sp.]